MVYWNRLGRRGLRKIGCCPPLEYGPVPHRISAIVLAGGIAVMGVVGLPRINALAFDIASKSIVWRGYLGEGEIGSMAYDPTKSFLVVRAAVSYTHLTLPTICSV